MVQSPSTTEEIETRAAGWILRRDRGELSLDDRAALETWLAADARHRAAYLRLSEAWEISAGLKAWRPVDGRIDPHVLAPSQRSSIPQESAPHTDNSLSSSRRRLAAWATVAASVLVVIVLGARMLVEITPTQVYATTVGGYQRVLLEDGSIVQLNTDTKVSVRFSPGRRELELARGEAYFNVAHDAERPFEVVANGTVVRAVGTAFSVRVRDSKRIDVIVSEGRVAVHQELRSAIQKAISPTDIEVSPPSILSAGEAAEATTGRLDVARVEQRDLERRLAWQTGELRFQKEPLATVVAEFNRYNRQRVEIADPQLAQREIGGAFKATDLDSFLAAMRSALGIRVEHTEDVVRLYAD